MKRFARAACGIAAILAGSGFLLTAAAAEDHEAVAAAVTEKWVCTDRTSPDGRNSLELTLRDGMLIEEPSGTQRYKLLINTAHAVIGVDSFGDFDPALGLVNIFVSTVVLDKAKGTFNISTSVSDKVYENYVGHCRQFEERPAAAADNVLAHRQ